MNTHLSALILGDSRISNFVNFGEKNQSLYHTTVRSISGGKIENITFLAQQLLNNIDQENFALIYCCAGICNITRKIHHSYGWELGIKEDIDVIEKIQEARDTIITAHPNAAIVFSTVPIVSFAKVIAYNKEHSKLSKSIFYPRKN